MFLVSIKIPDTNANRFCKRNVFKSDFTSILPTARLGSNFSTSLANENESFIVYLLLVLATYYRTLLIASGLVYCRQNWTNTWNSIFQSLLNFTKSIKYPWF